MTINPGKPDLKRETEGPWRRTENKKGFIRGDVYPKPLSRHSYNWTVCALMNTCRGQGSGGEKKGHVGVSAGCRVYLAVVVPGLEGSAVKGRVEESRRHVYLAVADWGPGYPG